MRAELKSGGIMRQADTYLVKEFADLAGVTVRTLHFYDQTGLLKPAQRTDSKHRLYRHDDLLRLQQILTLKVLGFSLDEIRRLLDSPAYDLRESLSAQKGAVDAHIGQLQQVSRALSKVLSREGELDWQAVTDIIEAVRSEERYRFFQQFFTPQQQEMLTSRSAQMSPDELEAGNRAWAEVIQGFKAMRGHPPGDPDVQALVARMADLVRQFTHGDEGIAQALKNMYHDVNQIPADLRPYDADLQAFMLEALKVFQQKNT